MTDTAKNRSIVQRQAERRTDEKAAADRAVAGMARRQQPQRRRVQESNGCYCRAEKAENAVRLLLLLSAPISLTVRGFFAYYVSSTNMECVSNKPQIK